MRIVRLDISNYKGVVEAFIEPQMDLVILEGRNGNGKSSVLDAIAAAMCGADWDRLRNADPLRDEETEGTIAVKLGNGLTVTRHYHRGGECHDQACRGRQGWRAHAEAAGDP
jgi:recombinational DNA repair ATPase RecF